MVKLLIVLDERQVVGRSDGSFFPIPQGQWDDFFDRIGNEDLVVGGLTFRDTVEFQENALSKAAGRTVYVLTRQKSLMGAQALSSVEEARSLLKNYPKHQNLWIVGGKSVYEALYDLADELIVSIADVAYDGDLTMNWDLSHYKRKLLKEGKDFKVYQYHLSKAAAKESIHD